MEPIRYDYYNDKIVINEEKAQGMVWCANGEKKRIANDNIKALEIELQMFSKNHFFKGIDVDPSLPVISHELLQGLRLIATKYQAEVINKMRMILESSSEVAIQFGVKGSVAQGEEGFPNYQITSCNQKEQFRGLTHKTFENLENDMFHEKNLTPPFSISQLKTLWCTNSPL